MEARSSASGGGLQPPVNNLFQVHNSQIWLQRKRASAAGPLRAYGPQDYTAQEHRGLLAARGCGPDDDG